VTTDGIWIGNRIYWTLTEPKYIQLRRSHSVTHSKDHCNYSTHKVFSVFTSRCLVVVSNGGRSPSLGLPNCPRRQMPKSKSHCDWRSVSQWVLVSSPIWGSWPDINYYRLTVTVLLLWGALSDERTSMSFVYAAGPCQCSLFDSFSLFVTSYDFQVHGGGIRPRLHTGHKPRRQMNYWSSLYSPGTDRTENASSIIACFLVSGETCPQSCSLATSVVLSPVYTAVTWQWVCISQYIEMFFNVSQGLSPPH
jgi:hypothetical protein